MKITIESTATIDTLEGQHRARIWRGTTESGIPVAVWVAVISPQIDPGDERQAQFVRELQEVPAQRQVAYYDITGLI